MFIFSLALLEDLRGSKQELVHKHVSNHPLPVARSEKVKNREIKKGL